MRHVTYRTISSVLCGVLIWPMAAAAESGFPAVAADSAQKPEATFSEAVKIFKNGDAARALPLFVHLGEVTDSPNVHLYVGYCQLELGHDLAAQQAFALALKLSVDSGEDKYGATREAAQAELTKLSLRLASLTISLVEVPAEFTVRLDGQPVDPSLLGSPMVVEPGLHRVEAEAKDRTSVTRDMTLVAGGFKTLALLLERHAERRIDLAAPAGNAPVAPRASSGSRWKVWGFVAGGLGVVGLGTFAVAGMQARSTYNRLQAECPIGCSDAAHRSNADSGKTYQTVANVGLALGIAGTLTSATLFYWDFTSGKAAGPSVDASPGLVKITYAGSF